MKAQELLDNLKNLDLNQLKKEIIVAAGDEYFGIKKDQIIELKVNDKDYIALVSTGLV